MAARVRVSAYSETFGQWRPGWRQRGAGWSCTAPDHIEASPGRGYTKTGEWRGRWSLADAADAGRAHLAECHGIEVA